MLQAWVDHNHHCMILKLEQTELQQSIFSVRQAADLDSLEDVDEEGALDQNGFPPHHGLEGLHVCNTTDGLPPKLMQLQLQCWQCIATHSVPLIVQNTNALAAPGAVCV